MLLLVWDYIGGAQGSAEALLRGEQRCYADDDGIDDVLGACKIKRFAVGEAELILEFTEGGEKEERPRTKGHVRALGRKPHRPQPPVAYEYEKNRSKVGTSTN